MRIINGIVYKATSPSGKVYIGITVTTLKERIRMHLRAVKSGSKTPFHRALKEYKLQNIKWDVLDHAKIWNELCQLERKYIKQHNSYKKGYNLTLGREGTFGLKHDEEWCLQNSKIRKIFLQNPDNRIMQSLANKKAHEENPDQAIEHSEFMKKRYTEESVREKTAAGMKRFLSDLVNRKIHSIQRGAKTFLVYRGDKLIGEWLTQRECVRALKLNFIHINHCLHGKRKSHGGYTFKKN